MATKTISLELDAYEKLKQAKRPGESFSSVVRRVEISTPYKTGAELVAELWARPSLLTEEDLKQIEEVRKHDTPATDPWEEYPEEQ